MRAKVQFDSIVQDYGEYEENTGSIIIFKGIVRRKEGSRNISYLHYEAEINIAEEEMIKILGEAMNNFKIIDANAVHRIGNIKPGEVSLLVTVFSEHREEGFRSCIYIVDNIKTRVPIWKQDVFEDGTMRWH